MKRKKIRKLRMSRLTSSKITVQTITDFDCTFIPCIKQLRRMRKMKIKKNY